MNSFANLIHKFEGFYFDLNRTIILANLFYKLIT